MKKLRDLKKCIDIFNKLDWKIYLLILVVIKLYIKAGSSLWIADGGADDLLYIDLAELLVETGWLGDFNAHTLTKMPGYAFFLALGSKLHIPYVFLLEALYVFAICVTLKAFKQIVNTNIRKNVVLTYLMFCPWCFDRGVSLRLYRLSIVPSFVLLVIATYAGLFFFKNESFKKKIGWAIGAGVSTFFFWIIREDSIWLAPYIFGAGVIIVLSSRNLEKKKFFMNIALVFMAYIVFGVGINSVKLINYNNYGVYLLTNFGDGNYARATSAILRVKPEIEKQYIWVDKATLNKILDCSPRLKQIENEIAVAYESYDAVGVLGVDGEVEKDYINWVLRQAASSAGIYSDAQLAENFWGIVADEVEGAFSDGRLQEREGIQVSNLAKPIESKSIRTWLECVGEGMVDNLQYSKFNVKIPIMTVDENYIRRTEILTRENIKYPDVISEISFEGWAYTPNVGDELEIVFTSSKGNESIAEMEWFEREDVNNYLESEGKQVADIQKVGFKVEYQDKEGIRKVEFYLNGELEYTVDLLKQQQALWIEKENLLVSIDGFEIEKAVNERDITGFEKTAEGIIKMYQNSSFLFNILSIMGFVLLVIRTIKYRKETEVGLLLVLLGIAGCYLALHLGVGLNYFEAHNRPGRHLYLAGAYPLQQLFIILTIFILFEIIKETKEKRKLRNEVNHSDTLL